MSRERSATRDVVFGCLVATIAVLSALVGWSIANNLLLPYQTTAALSTIEQLMAVENMRAQQATANWTFWMLMLGVASFVVTAIGAYFVWRTLIETAKATASAIASLDYTRRSTHVELRAYVIVESISLMDFAPGQSPKVVCTLVNSGLTPALRLRSKGTLMLLDQPDGIFKFKNNLSEAPTREIGANREAPYVAAGKTLTQADFDAVKSKEKHYVFGFRCTYRDVFGNKHSTIARAFLADVALPAGPGERMALVKKNNMAT